MIETPIDTEVRRIAERERGKEGGWACVRNKVTKQDQISLRTRK